MNSGRDPDREDDGFDLELPFLSLRFGRGAWRSHSMQPADEGYERARQRVRARLGFYRHLATYLAVIAAIGFIDLITGGGLSSPVLWIAGIWGAFIVWQAFNVFVFPSVWSRETEERMIQEELRRQREG